MSMKRTKNNSKVEGSGNKKRRSLEDPKSNEGEIPLFSRTLDNDESQREEGEQLTEKRSDKSEEKERNNNGHVEGEAAQVKDEAETNETDKPNGNVNSDRQSRCSDSDLSSNARTSEDEKIALIFRSANDKLDKIEANADKKKYQVARETAQKLEKILPMDRIASEMVKGFRGRISPSTIYAALEEKHKISYRVQNARKGKKEKEKTESLAPISELKQIIIDTSGHSTQQLVRPDSSDDGDNNKPQRQIGVTQDSKSVAINETQEVGSGNGDGIDTDTSPPATRDVTECEKCPIKDSRIEEVEDVVRKTTPLTSANQIAEVKLKQLKKELDDRNRELSDKPSQIAKLSDELKHIKEKQAEVHKDENLNFANLTVTNIGDFEFSLLLGDIKYHLAALYPSIGDGGKVWFSGKLDRDSGKILSIRFGRIGDKNLSNTQ